MVENVSVAVVEVGNVAAMVVVESSCYLLGEEVVGALCRNISINSTNSYVNMWPFLSKKIFNSTIALMDVCLWWYPAEPECFWSLAIRA